MGLLGVLLFPKGSKKDYKKAQRGTPLSPLKFPPLFTSPGGALEVLHCAFMSSQGPLRVSPMSFFLAERPFGGTEKGLHKLPFLGPFLLQNIFITQHTRVSDDAKLHLYLQCYMWLQCRGKRNVRGVFHQLLEDIGVYIERIIFWRLRNVSILKILKSHNHHYNSRTWNANARRYNF